MNVFTFTGRLGSDGEVRYTPSNVAVCNFSVAVESGYGDKKATTWVRCALWGKRATGGLPDCLKKGVQVCVSGELSTREYESNGEKRTSVEVNVRELTLIGGRGEQAPQQRQAPQQSQQDSNYPAAPQQGDDFEEDSRIPF